MDNTQTQVLARSRRKARDNNYQDSIAILSNYIDIHPKDLVVRAERGLRFMTTEQHDLMEADIAFVLGQSPHNAAEYAAQGLALAIKGFAGPISESKSLWSKASDSFGRALQMNPDCIEAYHFRIQLLTWQGKPHHIILQDLDRAIALTPNDADLYSRRAYHRRENNDKRGGLADMSKLIELEPENANNYRARYAIWDEDDYPHRVADLDKSIELDPNSLETYEMRGMLHEIMGNHQLAQIDYNRILATEPDNIAALTWRASLRAQHLNDLQGAVEDFTRLIQLKPDSWGYEQRSKLYSKLGDHERANQDREIAAQIKTQEKSTTPVQHTPTRFKENIGKIFHFIQGSIDSALKLAWKALVALFAGLMLVFGGLNAAVQSSSDNWIGLILFVVMFFIVFPIYVLLAGSAAIVLGIVLLVGYPINWLLKAALNWGER